MTKEQRPTSKVIQIISCMNEHEELFRILCEDGSTWLQGSGEKWICILEAHKEPVVKKSLIGDEEQEALEELQDFIRAKVQSFRMPLAAGNFIELFTLAQKLVNALEKRGDNG